MITLLLSIILVTTPPVTAPPKVVVVGGGLAGMTAAYRLQQNGFDVDVYEARGRVGGRILSTWVGGNVEELGGQNIVDGGEAGNVRRLIDEFGLELQERTGRRNYYYSDGDKLLSKQELLGECPQVSHHELQLIAQESKTLRDVFLKIFQPEDPLYRAFATWVAGYEGAPIEHLSPIYVETLHHLLSGIGGGSGDHNRAHVTMSNIKGGNALLTEKLAGALGNKVHLHSPLTSVKKARDGSYALTFSNGQTAKADLLVLAVPCSVYKDIDFEEGTIPEERLRAIQDVRYGTNAKILVPFPDVPADRSSLFNDRIFAYFASSPHVLTLYHTGEPSRFRPDTVLETYQQDRPLLEVGFGSACPPFVPPVIAQDQHFVSYEIPVGYSWPNDPYARGSYHYIAPGQELLLTTLHEEQGELVKSLFAPIDQTLYFAGEHASILMEVPGTMEAACESGERAARMITATLGKTEQVVIHVAP